MGGREVSLFNSKTTPRDKGSCSDASPIQLKFQDRLKPLDLRGQTASLSPRTVSTTYKLYVSCLPFLFCEMGRLPLTPQRCYEDYIR